MLYDEADTVAVEVSEPGFCVIRSHAVRLVDPERVQALVEGVSHHMHAELIRDENASTPRFVLALNRVEHICSGALAGLLKLHREARSLGAELHLAELKPRVRDVIRVMNLHRLLQIHERVEDARPSQAAGSLTASPKGG